MPSRTSARTATTKKSAPARKAASGRSNVGSTRGGSKPQRSATSVPSEPREKRGKAIATDAAQQLLDLTGREVEGVTALEPSEDGWIVTVEALEVRRIPITTDVLATYEVHVDPMGEIQSYRRLRRYERGVPGED
jgi:hypothetical protein